MTKTIRIINPNSNTAVTDGMSQALEPLRNEGGSALDCVTLAEGPSGIESEADSIRVAPLLAEYMKADNEADTFVIGCYSGPGLHLCREVTDRSVFGIAECAITTALTRGGQFGVIAILANSVGRHMRHMQQTLGFSVTDVEGGADTFERMAGICRQLRDTDGADTIIMGCAGMARNRIPLEEALGLPVIDPTQAPASIAIGKLAVASR